MKRGKKSLIFCFLFSLLLIPMQARAAGNPEVIYDAGIHKFKLVNVTDTDLFVDFKEVMPGDEIATPIRVEAKNVKNPVTMYLKSVDDTIPECLESVVVRVELDGTIVSEDTIGSALNGGTPILLGKFTESGVKNVDVTLLIPTSLGNEVENLEQAVHWEWVAEEDDGESHSSGPAADTGDYAATTLYGTLGVMAVMVLLVLKRKSGKIE